jgi:two-component sensor histidine kinase
MNIQRRIKSIALVHEKLYQDYLFSEINFDEYLNELVAIIHSIYQCDHKKIDFELSAAPLRINMDKAIPLGLLTSELITNAYKHAFKNNFDGKINISLEQQGDSNYKLFVKDGSNGTHINELYKDHSSLGVELIHTLCKQINANAELNDNNGSGVSILFSLDNISTN